LTNADGLCRQELGSYRLERVLGQGGLGTVYLASRVRDTAARASHGVLGGREDRREVPRAASAPPGQVAALKVIDLAGAESAVLAQAFRREAEASRRLDHPSVVDVYEAGEAGTLAYIAMEYMPGGDLSQRASPRAPSPLRDALHIGERVALALAHAHALGIVHRDVKPANILLAGGPGTAKLSDFGLARLADLQRSRTGVFAGTPAYMAPEQLAAAGIDARADLYSLGVVLFELLTGRLPHESHSLGELLRQVSIEPAPPLSSLRPEAPPALSALLARLLAKQREARPGDAAALADELAALRRALDP
jgi:serine/threonine-protein kinase